MAFVLAYGFVRRFSLVASTLAVLIPGTQAQAPVADPEASFQNRVQPIVFKNCNGCHTFGGHAGELRMDSLATLMKGGDRGPVVVPGHPESSCCWKHPEATRISKCLRAKLKLDIAAIEKWILGCLPTLRPRVRPTPDQLQSLRRLPTTPEAPAAVPPTPAGRR
jgi:hypothetical protein